MALHVPVRSVAGLMLLLAAGTGCAAAHGGRPHAASSKAARASSPTPTSVAVDGRDLKACADGNCEVLVTHPVDIPVHGHGGVDEISVDAIGSDGVKLSVKSGGGSGSSSVGVGCAATFYLSGGSTGSQAVCGDAGIPLEKIRGVVSVQLVSLSGKSAVLRLVSGAKGEPPASIAPRMDVPDFG